MNPQKILVFLALLLISTTAFALTYRSDVNTGSWSQYDSGLASAFYAPDTGQNIYNRNMETAFNHSGLGCAGQWCNYNGDGAFVQSSDFAKEGTYSMKVTYAVQHPEIGAEAELVGDSNVSFWIKSTTDNFYGYVNDQNVFVNMGTSPGTFVWVYVSFTVPAGKYRIEPMYKSGNETGTTYIDDVRVTRLNTGTFNASNNAPTCSSIAACSNITYHLPSSELKKLWFVADYVPSASCLYVLNQPKTYFGAYTGSMTEGSGGMYYLDLNQTISSNDYKDVNIMVSCSKVPYQNKSFFVTARLNKYGNITNGNFETTIPSTAGKKCAGNWCNFDGDGAFVQSTDFAKEGIYSMKVTYSVQHPKIASQSDYSGGATASFWIYSPQSIQYGYVDDSNNFASMGSSSGLSTWEYISYAIPTGNYRIAPIYISLNQSGTIYIDNVQASNVQKTTVFAASNDAGNNAIIGAITTFYATYVDEEATAITDANCPINFGDNSTGTMTYNSSNGRYETTHGYVSSGAFTVTQSCAKATYNDGNSSTTFTAGQSATDALTVEAIQGIASITPSFTSQQITLNGTDQSTDLIFRAKTSSSSFNFRTNWVNADSSGKQYFIYTSTDGTNWSFNDTLTFGATNSTPIQKIWNGTNYAYSFSPTVYQNTWTYFKLSYMQPALYWNTIKESTDWINVNNPSAYTDSNNQNFDVFSDSNYTNVQSYTVEPYQNLTSSTLPLGYELQFTAYATSAGTLKLGSRIPNTPDSVIDVNITTSPTRFSIPIAPGARNAALLIKSTAITSNTYYLTDYALVPRAYFYGQLEIKNRDNTSLQAILRDGNYYSYIKEGIAFNVLTNFYDTNGDLSYLRVDTMFGGIVIKTTQFNLTSSIGQNISFGETVDGVIDLNGTAGALNQLEPLRDVTIVATLVNKSGASVAQQFKTIKLLQFPYFANDLSMYFDVSNKKVGASPTLTFKFNVQDPANLIGFEFDFHDANHTIQNPNYQKTILLSEFGCLTNFNCTKQITFDDYKWEAPGSYVVDVVALLKTENKNYVDFLAIQAQVIQISYSGYEVMRILQAYERRDLQYRADEPIALILQVRDDKGLDLFNTIKPYIALYAIDDIMQRTDYHNAWLPKSHAYDQVTGMNYWFWNNIFTDDSGNLFTDGNSIGFIASWVDNTQGHNPSGVQAQLARRCEIGGYGSDFDNSQLGHIGLSICDITPISSIACSAASWLGIAARAINDGIYGCAAGYETGAIVNATTGTLAMIDINTSYAPKANQTQSLICLSGINPDTNTYRSIETGLQCVVFYKKSEQSIDGFHIQVTNKNGDLSQTDPSTKQYLDFWVSQEEIWLNDIEQLRQVASANYDTKEIHTYGQFLAGLWKGTFGSNRSVGVIPGSILYLGNGLFSGIGIVTGAGMDFNFDSAFDPTLIDGAFSFSLNPKIINLSDYTTSNPEILDLDLKTFRNYALVKKIKIAVNTSNLEVGIPNGDVLWRTNTLLSPLVDYIPYKTQKDSNGVEHIVSAITQFDIISDMYSNNETRMNRGTAKVALTVTPTKPSTVINLMELFTNPGKFLQENWFLILVAIVALIFVTLIVVPWIIAIRKPRG